MVKFVMTTIILSTLSIPAHSAFESNLDSDFRVTDSWNKQASTEIRELKEPIYVQLYVKEDRSQGDFYDGEGWFQVRIDKYRMYNRTIPNVPEDYELYFGGLFFTGSLTPVSLIKSVEISNEGTKHFIIKFRNGEVKNSEFYPTKRQLPDGYCPKGATQYDLRCVPIDLLGSYIDWSNKKTVMDYEDRFVVAANKFEFYDAKNGSKMIQSAHEEFKKQRRFDGWRNLLKQGSETSCGMVVEVKDKLAYIQTKTGAVWMRKDKLQPESEKGSCKV